MALVNYKVKNKFEYHPKTTDELVKYIQTELKDGNTNLNCIDTSNITDMSDLFSQTLGIKLKPEQQENLDISDWDVSNVENMNSMFYKCDYFNSDLSNWDVSNVKFMQDMFWYCKQFNSDLSNWNVSNVEKMYGMFCRCEQFNSDLSNWDVSNVKQMQQMFYKCKQFNCDLSNWNVSNIIIMGSMFYDSGLEGKEPSWYKK